MAVKRAPVVHELKSWPQYFRAVADGSKKFEVRENDRDFQAGDYLLLREWYPDHADIRSEVVPYPYSGNIAMCLVTYILVGGGKDDPFRLPGNIAFLAIDLLDVQQVNR